MQPANPSLSFDILRLQQALSDPSSTRTSVPQSSASSGISNGQLAGAVVGTFFAGLLAGALAMWAAGRVYRDRYSGADCTHAGFVGLVRGPACALLAHGLLCAQAGRLGITSRGAAPPCSHLFQLSPVTCFHCAAGVCRRGTDKAFFVSPRKDTGSPEPRDPNTCFVDMQGNKTPTALIVAPAQPAAAVTSMPALDPESAGRSSSVRTTDSTGEVRTLNKQPAMKAADAVCARFCKGRLASMHL